MAHVQLVLAAFIGMVLATIALSGCAGPSKVFTKNCKHIHHDIYECEEL